MADTLEAANEGPIILRKKITLPEEPHGGAWKVAYADFVTAMMAFFLLLWLLNVTTEDKKQGISNFFEPIGVSDEQTGSGGVLKGLAMSVEGALRSAGSPPRITIAIPTFGSRDAGSTEGQHEQPKSSGGGLLAAPHRKQVEEESKTFKKVVSELRQAVQDIPELTQMQDTLMIEETPEGLRIQLLDRVKLRMFQDAGKGERISERGRHFLAIIASIVGRIPNRIAVSGHTDLWGADEASNGSKWEISGNRAVNARKALVEFGLNSNRFYRVVGRADTRPLHPNFPKSPRNGRISVLLLRDAPDTSVPAGAEKPDGG